MTGPTAKEIAAALRNAYNRSSEEGFDTVSSYFADTIEVPSSDPVQPSLFLEREMVRSVRKSEFVATHRVLTDHVEELDFSVDGAEIRCIYTASGTMSDGLFVKFATPVTYTVEDGEIVKIAMTLSDTDDRRRVYAAIQETGLVAVDPEELLS